MNEHDTTGRRGLTAIALVAAPTLVAVGDLLAGSDPDSSQGVLTSVAASPHQFYLSRALFFAGMLLLIPGVITLLRLVPERGRRWATTGAILTGMGAAGAGAGEFALGFVFPTAADSAIPRNAAVAALDSLQADALFAIPFMIGLFGFIGPAVIGIGIARARTLPRPLTVALIVAPVLWFVGVAGSYTLGAIGSIPLLVTYALLAIRSDERVAVPVSG